MPAVTSASFDPSSFSFKTFISHPLTLDSSLAQVSHSWLQNLTSLSSTADLLHLLTNLQIPVWVYRPVLPLIFWTLHISFIFGIHRYLLWDSPRSNSHPWAIRNQEIPISGTCFERSSLYSPLYWSLCSLRPSVNIMFIIVSQHPIQCCTY